MEKIEIPEKFKGIVRYYMSDCSGSIISSKLSADGKTLSLEIMKSIDGSDLDYDDDFEIDYDEDSYYGKAVKTVEFCREDSYLEDFEDEVKGSFLDGEIEETDGNIFQATVTDSYSDSSISTEITYETEGSFDEPPSFEFDVDGQLDLYVDVDIELLDESLIVPEQA